MANQTVEEILKALAAYARENGDEWRLSISRRVGIGSPVKVAGFDGVKIEHITFPEAWLPRLLGGGEYVFDLYHARSVNTHAATMQIAKLDGPPKALDRAVLRAVNWTGPPVEGLFYPSEERATDSLPDTRDREGRVAPDNTVGAGVGLYSHPPPRGATTEERLMAEMRRMEEDHRRREASLAEDRRRIEIDALKAATDAKVQRLEAKLGEALDAMKRLADRPVEPSKPQPTIVEQVVPLIGALTPIFGPYLAAQKAAEEKRLEREAAERIEREKREAALHEKLANQGAETAKVMASMADVVSNSMRAQLQTVATMQELLNPPQQEEGLIGVVKEGIRAFAEFASVKAQAEASRPALPATGNGAPTPPTPLDDAGEEVDLADADPIAVMDEVIRQLQAHVPAGEAANFYVEALRANAGFATMVKNAGGTVNAFQARLGDWLKGPGNYDYIKSVLAALQAIQTQMKAQQATRPAAPEQPEAATA